MCEREREREQLDLGSDDPEKCTIAEDAPVKFFSTVDAGDETVEQSFQVESLEEAAPELNGDNKAYKEEDDVERNNLIDEEKAMLGPSKKIEEEKDEGKQIPNDGIRDVAISTITENPEIQNDEEEILEIGEGAKDKVDCPLPTLLKDNTSVEDEIQDKNNLDSPLVIETEEMYLQKPQKPEILKEVSESGPEDVVKESPKPKEVEDQTEILEKTAQADSTTNEKGKDDENPEQKLADSFIEQSFLQHSEPKNEKLETSLNVISEMMETATSSENAETITCVKDEISIKNLEQSFEEKGKEDKPTDTDDIREHGIPIEKLDLNEKTESAEVEIPERKVNDLHITHLLVEETEQVECGKLEEVSKFQPQEEFNEANGASTEEEKPIEEASEACKSTERTTLEHLSTEETKKNEALDTDMHQISMKIDDTEEGIIKEDAPTEVCRAVGMGDETVEQSFQGERLEEAAPELNGDNTSYKVEDNVERNSIVDEEVHGGPMITGKGDVTKEHMIEHNVRYITPELIEEETTKSFQDNETKAEGSKGEDTGEDTKEQIIEEGNVIDLSPESVAEGPVKNFQDDEKEAEKSKEEIVEEGNVIDLSPESVAEGPVKNFQDDEKEEEKFKEEIFEDSETAEPGEGIACETIQDDEIPGKKFYPSSVKQVERLQGEEDLSPMEASGEEKQDEDGSFVMVTGDEDNITRLVNAKENTEKEMPKDDEDAKQILQQDEPGEKLERSLIVMSEETEEGVTSADAGKFTRMREEADVRNLEETLEEEIKEAAKDTDDTKGIGIAKEEDLELVAEESRASKSTESTDLELNSKESETEVEELINGCKLDSTEELEDKDASKNVGEETKNEETSDLSLHKVETENASAEKSMEDVDGTVKDSSTVCIGEEVVELNCPEDENAQKSMEEAEPKSNGGDQSCKTDNETENLKNKFVNEEVYESPRVASMGEDIEEHIIQKEHTATDIIPESNGEDIFKSSEEDEKEEEKSKVEAFETISAGQNTREQIMEIDSVTDHPPESTEKETLEESPKEDKVCEEFETTASSTTTIKQNIEECATPDLSSLSVGEETIRESSEEDGNKSDAIEVKSYKAEDDADWNNIIEKKVHDEPKIPSTEEVITEDTIDSNVQYISPELTKDETVKSFQDNEKEEERSKGEDTKEKIIGKGNVIDLSPESIAEGPVKNFEDNGKEAEKFKGELEEESETAEAVMSIAREIYKDDESSDRIFHASSSVKQEERLQGEGEDLSPTKASEGEKREVDKSTIMVTGDEDNITNLVKVEENSENKTSKDDEDAKQILQKDEPVEKLERSINVHD
ncbi:hypothetical protein L1049_002192 [Liquidambar formosana]|uniref:Titin-like n=1 Tax=Liquidambar formosana TaxID=63359 RepID=A0AAP0R6G7_LIQFO